MTMLQDVTSEGEKTSLDKIAVRITQLGGGVFLTFAVLFVVWLTDVIGATWQRVYFTHLMDSLMVVFTIFVGAVPEGLPLAVVIALGYLMKMMMRDNNFVRHVSVGGTTGGATPICSDKAALTLNKMTIVTYHMDGHDFDNRPNLTPDVIGILSVHCNQYEPRRHHEAWQCNPGIYWEEHRMLPYQPLNHL
jgi:Ca2+-transporting ATPase